MKKPGDPELVTVEKINNAAIVQFRDEPEPFVFPAVLLHAARDLARIMHEKDLEEEHQFSHQVTHVEL